MNPPPLVSESPNNITIKVGGFHVFKHYHPKKAEDFVLLEELGRRQMISPMAGKAFQEKCKHLQFDELAAKNIIVTTGLAFLAQILCNTATETNKYVNYFAVGTDNTAAAAGDTTLGTENTRKAVSSALDSSNVANISTFFGASEANATWEEWGHFIDASATTDSGTMLSHHIQQQVKASPNTITVDSTYTFSDA
tara:strand:+ start:7854 stop:8438 length:585 start_codon:yes stop_codon:yes gene_type:complete